MLPDPDRRLDPGRRLDPEQLAAVSMRRNGTVSAGAGSGKTTVLAARYIDLIASSGADVRSILTLTFTRKAAAEMYSRIYSGLVSSAIPAVREQASRFSEASISTIDSFCGTVIRSSAARYGYPPDFTTDDDMAQTIAVDEALSYLLENRADPALCELAARLGFTPAWKNLFADLAYRMVAPFPDEEGGFAGIAKKTVIALAGIIRDETANLATLGASALLSGDGIAKPGKDCACAMAFFVSLPGELDRLSWNSGSRETAPADSYADVDAGVAADALILAEIARAAKALTMRSYSASDPGQTLVKEAAKTARDTIAPILLAAAELLGDLGLMRAVMNHLDAFSLRYRAAKRTAGIMGFGDVARCATQLLRTRPEIRSWWKERFRFIMIDEFQDNNAEQKNLLFLLAEKPELSAPGIPCAQDLVPDKLFFVGDEKQSIYMFRGADVSVFRTLDRELAVANADLASDPASAAAPDNGMRLETNYRSEPGLVDFFNSAFFRIMSDPREDFEARFAGINSRSPTPGLAPTIRYLLREKPDTGKKDPAERSEDEILAFGIAGFVREHVARRDLPVADAGGGIRPATYGDFAILLRTTTNQHLLERFFRILDIPYSASAVCGLFTESPVNDIYNTLRLTLLPEDRTAFAAVLRSPMVRVSDDALILILSATQVAEQDTATATPRGTAPGALRTAFSPDGLENSLSEGDRARFERGRSIFSALGAMADRIPLPELVSWIWQEAGLRAAILSKPDAHPYLEHFEFVFDLACKAEAAGKNLSAFLSDDVEPFIGTIEKQDIDNLQRDHAVGVRIMTVHKSKGLEFPVVIIPWTNTTGVKNKADDAWFASEHVGVSINLKPYDRPCAKPSGRYRNIFFERAKERQRKKTVAETKRLLYVACTRAISHLVFAGFEPSRKSAEGLSFHSLLAGGDGMKTADGCFRSLEPEVSLETIRSLTTLEYKALFRGVETRSHAVFEPAYRQARILDRDFPRRDFSATELEAILEAAAVVDLDMAGSIETACPDMPFPRLPHESEAEAYEESGDGTVFGRICHAVLEARLRGAGPFDLVDEALVRDIPARRLAGIKTDALALAERYAETALGKTVSSCSHIETEKEFLLALPGSRLAKGRMDLFARSGNRIIIVDFKTHRSARRGAYDLQLWLYRMAARALHPDVEIETWLVWLRGPAAVPVDTRYSDSDLENLVAQLDERRKSLCRTP